MTSLDVAPGTYGAKRQSFAKANPRDLLLEVLRKNPSELEEVVKERVRSLMTPEHMEAVFDYWFANNYRSSLGMPSQRIKRSRAARDVVQRLATKIKTRHTKVLHQILMTQPLSTGRSIGDSTFEDCRREGGWLLAVARKGKPHQIVRDVLSEADLSKIWQKAKRAA